MAEYLKRSKQDYFRRQGYASGYQQGKADEQELIVSELEILKDNLWQDTDSELRIVKANAWDKIDLINKIIEMVKEVQNDRN